MINNFKAASVEQFSKCFTKLPEGGKITLYSNL